MAFTQDTEARATRLLLPLRSDRLDWSQNRFETTVVGTIPINSDAPGLYPTNARFDNDPFSGSDNYIVVAYDNTQRLLSKSWIIEVWVYFTQADRSTGDNHLVAECNGGSGNRSWRLEVDNGGAVFFRVSFNGSTWNNLVASVGTIKHSQWHHIAASRRGGLNFFISPDSYYYPIKLFVDGEEKASLGTVNQQNVYSPENVDIEIGRIMRGRMEDFRLRANSHFSGDPTNPYLADFTPPPAHTGVLAGTTRDGNDDLAARTWRAYYRNNGTLFSEGVSNSSGEFTAVVPRMPMDLQIMAGSGDGCDLFLPARTPALE